jgi:hypothetical protein
MSGRRRSIGGLDQAAWLRPAFVSQIVGVRDRIKELVLSSVRASSHRKIRIERSPLTKTLHQSTAARYSIDLGAVLRCESTPRLGSREADFSTQLASVAGRYAPCVTI